MSKTVVHMVLFKFPDSASEHKRRVIFDELLLLKKMCLQPGTNEPYMLSASGGANMSMEGLADGFHYGFVAEFASTKDRDYYVNEDPAHQEFIKTNKQNFERVIVLDYEKDV